MPIYAYRCATCGFENDVLQKVSDARLTTCPECKAETFDKQLTAAGFQLKGSGWYATDFKSQPAKQDKAADKTSTDSAAPAAVDAKTTPPASPATSGTTSGNAPTSTPAST
jgi:putative FmdB family regulatory protein